MTTFLPVWHDLELSKLQRTIIERGGVQGTTHYHGNGGPTITAPLKSVADAVESAYILTAKDELPKVTDGKDAYGARYFNTGTIGDVLMPLRNSTPDEARKRATAWLAVARHLEREEKAKAYEEAKAKAEADAAARAAEGARQKRLDELADQWFGEKYYTYLGPNKAAAIKEIYRLETRLGDAA